MATSAIIRAFNNVDRSYASAKASVADPSAGMFAHGPSSPLIQRSNLGNASEQLKHFRGWVYSSIRPIAQQIAGQTVHVGRVGRPGNRKGHHEDIRELDSHPILDLLANPNDLMVGWSLMFQTLASLELTGRSLWWLPKKQQVLPIPSSWIIGYTGSTSFQSFRIRPSNTAESFDLPRDEIVYFNYPNPADPHGATSPLQAVGSAVDADEAISVSQLSMFRQGIHPSTAIIVGKDPHPDVPGGVRPRLTGSQERQVISAIRKRYSGSHRHGEPLILDGLIEDVKILSNSPAEMDWQNSGKATKERIVQAFGTNPIIMGEIEGANRASATVADQHFCDFTINPKIELLSQCLTEYLSPMFAKDGEKLKIWIEPCVPNDAEMNLKRMDLVAKHGVITAHELREFAGLNQEAEFNGILVGGSQTGLTRSLEEAVAQVVDERWADHAADSILANLGGNRNANTQPTFSGNGNGR